MSTFRNSARTYFGETELEEFCCAQTCKLQGLSTSLDQNQELEFQGDWNPNASMALRISATGFVSILFLVVLTIRLPGCLVGSRTRLWRGGSAGVGGMNSASDCTSWRQRLVAGDELGRKGWRKLLFARRRSAPGVESVPGRSGEPATNKLQGQASLSRFAAAFSFFSSMAKGSPSPSPATPSPGHN